MEATDKNGGEYLKENNQGVQIDSDPLLDDMPEYLSVARSDTWTDISLTGGMRFLALHFLLLVEITH